MKRTTFITTLLALMLTTLGIQSALAQSTMRRTYDDLEVDIWTDKDDGSNYYEGDDIYIYFRASEDAYVVVYDLDTRGNINMIFPEDPSDNNYVEGGEVYMIPNPNADYTYTLEGPPGDENLQAIASRDFFPVPDWRGPVNVYDKDRLGVEFDGDNQEFIAKVNFKYFPQNSAYDQVSFYVAPGSYYEPVESDCYGDCGQVYIDYPNGCEVYVDGVFYGYAPLYVPHAYIGRHRVTVYWGTAIVYNDWIVISRWDPFFVYPRPIWVYDYCWNHYYRDYHWGYYDYYGHNNNRYPSQTKYKNGNNFYSYHKPEPKRGYKVVPNSHQKYTKSKAYSSAKTQRITKFKTQYGYNKTTKTFTKSTAGGKAGYKSGTTAKRGVQGTVNGKSTTRGSTAKKTYNSKNRGTYKNGSTSTGNSKGTVKGGSGSSGGKKGGSYNGGSKSSGGSSKGSSGSSKGGSKAGSGKKSGNKSTVGEKKSGGSSDSGSKSSGGSVKKSAPKKGGSSGKSGSGSKSGSSKSSGSKSKGKSKK